MAFNKDFFKQQNQKLKDNAFPELEDALCNATLVDANLNNSKNTGRLQASFQWKIDPDESKNANRMAFSHIGLTEKDDQGNMVPAEGGYTAFSVTMFKLGLNNVDAVADDPEGALQAVIGSKVRLKIETKGEFQNIRVQKLLYSPLTDGGSDPTPQPETAAGGNGVQTPVQTAVAAPEPQPEPENSNAAAYNNKPFTNDGTVEVKEGMPVIWRSKEGQVNCVVETELEDSDQILLRKVSGGKPFMAARVDCFFVIPNDTVQNPVKELTPEPVPEPVSEEPIVLEVGMNLRGKYKGEVITGKVKKIEEQIEVCWITMGSTSYPCPFETLEVIK